MSNMEIFGAVRYTAAEYAVRGDDVKDEDWRYVKIVRRGGLSKAMEDEYGGFLDELTIADLVPELDSFGFSNRDLFWVSLSKLLEFVDIEVEDGFFPLESGLDMTVQEMALEIIESLV